MLDTIKFKKTKANGVILLFQIDATTYYLYLEYWENDKILFEIANPEFSVRRIGEQEPIGVTKENVIYKPED
ncbi:MAG: hypothetical protein V4538_08610 [Bacteroidota bacterium]